MEWGRIDGSEREREGMSSGSASQFCSRGDEGVVGVDVNVSWMPRSVGETRDCSWVRSDRSSTLDDAVPGPCVIVVGTTRRHGTMDRGRGVVAVGIVGVGDVAWVACDVVGGEAWASDSSMA